MAASPVSIALHGATLSAVLINGIPHVTLRSLCEALGLNIDGQRHRVQRHPVLSQGAAITALPSGRGDQQTLCIPLSLLNGWLFGIHASRVRPELRERLMQYQRECFDVLAAHFGAGPAVAPPAPAHAAQLAPQRYTADVDQHGRLTLSPWQPGSVAGTPAQLAEAIASGGWPLLDVARLQQASAQATLRHAEADQRRRLQQAAEAAQAGQPVRPAVAGPAVAGQPAPQPPARPAAPTAG